MQWLSDIVTPIKLREYAPATNAALDEADETRRFIEDMAVITNHGRRVGGIGDGKIIGLIPMGLAPTIWKFEPEVFLDTKSCLKFLDKNPAFKVGG